uniref:Uncharacterized protein n=1 Tax=Candidatus Giovannonibacteria bacterium GW2011_GWF2_42_19 TaxID=1618659 RepID=A0A0G0ZJL7_9BACT|nr:MAG: hypothetical protein UV11_C0001G0035 [Candidatus Giovannonibacteria bacterium GW2011_GWF2_42_19]
MNKEAKRAIAIIAGAVLVVVGIWGFVGISFDEAEEFVSTDGIKSVEYIEKEDLPAR